MWRRRLLTLCSALSLLLCMTVCSLWARGYRHITGPGRSLWEFRAPAWSVAAVC